jgi:hypothetical protein
VTAARSLPDLSQMVARLPLEWVLTDEAAFGLTTASPLQRAVCRIADGRPLRELAHDPVVLRALGGTAPACMVPPTPPRELAILSGIRVGKSLLAAALAFHWSQTCDVTRLGPGEVPRVSIVSLTKDLADVVFAHVVGRLQSSPLLAGLVLGEPQADCITVRHPTGRPIEIKVVAGSRAGASLVARWSAGTIFDEFPRMVGESDGVVNWDDSRNSVILRLLPGAQLMHIGSPWAPFGPAYELVADHWGKPTSQMVVIKAPAFDMNPVYWTPEQVAEAALQPDAYRTEVLGEFATPEQMLFSAELVTKAIKPEAGPEPGHVYTAAMDPATRGNAWAFGVFTRTGRQMRMVKYLERAGTRDEPLSPREVFRDLIGPECRRYGVTSIQTDNYYIDALQDIAREFGLSLVANHTTDAERTEKFMAIKTRLEVGEVELVEGVRADMMRLRKKITQAGIQIVLPVTGDGRHCDAAPVVMLGIGRYLRDAEPEKPKKDPEAERMLAQVTKRFGRRKT